jgi:hypothetical protein
MAGPWIYDRRQGWRYVSPFSYDPVEGWVLRDAVRYGEPEEPSADRQELQRPPTRATAAGLR